MRPRRLALLLVAVLVTTSVGTAFARQAFLQTFDSAPPAPLAWRPADWDVTIHSRSPDRFNALEPMDAMHGSDCSAPPASHRVSAYEDAVFICNGHVMTAISDEGYALIYLTPNQLVDLSGGEAVVRFDLSTLKTSGRDWVDLWLTPFGQNLQLVLDEDLPDGNGLPRNAVHIRMDNFGEGTGFRAQVIRNFVAEDLPQAEQTPYESVLTPSAVRRDTFELRISRTHIRFGMPAYGLTWIDTVVPDLGWSAGVLQLGHHSYNPRKDGAGNVPNTWHWDNLSISSAVPFTIVPGVRRYVDATVPGFMQFTAPAPANAFLRFTGIGNGLSVSFDGGRSWQAAKQQEHSNAVPEEHFKSYWMPVPAGTSTVQVRGQDWFGGPWMVRDFSIWSSIFTGVAPPPPAAPAYGSRWVSQSPYPVLVPGAAANVSLTFRNSGTVPWVRGAPGQQANLGINGDDRSYTALAVDWPTPDRVAIQSEPLVQPGDLATFRFSVRAPATPGTYAIHLRPVIDGTTWLDDEGVFLVVTSDHGFHSVWLAQSPFPALRPGEVSGPLSITFRNTGSRAWVRGVPGQEARLGVVADDTRWAGLEVGWPFASRVAAQSEPTVAPGGTGTFTFQVRAPATPGTYVIRLRPVIDGTTWMEDEGVYLLITVR